MCYYYESFYFSKDPKYFKTFVVTIILFSIYGKWKKIRILGKDRLEIDICIYCWNEHITTQNYKCFYSLLHHFWVCCFNCFWANVFVLANHIRNFWSNYCMKIGQEAKFVTYVLMKFTSFRIFFQLFSTMMWPFQWGISLKHITPVTIYFIIR